MATRGTVQELEDIIPARGDHGLDDVGSAFGSTGKIFDTWDFPLAKGHTKIKNVDFKVKLILSKILQEKKNLPSVTGRQICIHDLRFLQDQRC